MYTYTDIREGEYPLHKRINANVIVALSTNAQRHAYLLTSIQPRAVNECNTDNSFEHKYSFFNK